MNVHFRPRGFTLIELMVTVALVTVMMTLAASGLQRLLANQQVSAAASDLLTASMQARSTALKNNQRVIVQPGTSTQAPSGTWDTGYVVYVDVAQDSTFNSGTSGTDTMVLTQEALPGGLSISKVSGTNNFFGYEGSGFLASIGGSANSTWLVSSTKTDRKKYMVIERSGRARICDPLLVRSPETCP